MKYDYKAVEAKWQKVWEDEKTFHAEIDHSKPKFYALVEFPYPSAAGLHVGHPRSYTALDVVARRRRQCGYNVLYPMGWDAFGLPTENYAMKNHIHPAIVTKKNVARFKAQLKSLGLSFDAVYSGYLGSFEQVGIVEEFLSMFRSEDTLVLVDPAMADGGQLYKTFSPPFVQEMKGLCMHADLLVPNITEAAMLTGETYREGPYDHAYIETLLRGLLSLGARQAVLTGVWFDQRQYGAASLALGERAPHYVFSPRVDGFYHGTGDVFASALLAARLNGRPLEEAARIAVDLTCGSILRTRAAGTDLRFGVNFEEGLPAFIRALGL